MVNEVLQWAAIVWIGISVLYDEKRLDAAIGVLQEVAQNHARAFEEHGARLDDLEAAIEE